MRIVRIVKPCSSPFSLPCPQYPPSRGYFVTWAYTPEFDGDQGTVKQRAAHGQGKRRKDVLAVLWGKGELSTYEIHASKNGVRITGDGELWLPARVPNLTSIR